MIEDNKNTVEDITASDVSSIENQAESADISLTGSKLHITDLANKAYEMEKKLVYQSHKIPFKIKILASNGLDLAKHPSRYAQLGASFTEGMAGQSLGGALGAGLGTVFGPAGIVVGAELGSLVGGVVGTRHGSKLAKRFVNPTGVDNPLKEDLEKKGSAKVGGHTGKLIGGFIGNALFDETGSKICEEVGNKIGFYAGNLVFNYIGKIHIKSHHEADSEDVSQTNHDEP